MSGTFTLTGRLLQHDHVTPHGSVSVKADAVVFADSGDHVIYTQGAEVVTDADGGFSVTLLTETDLYYTVRSESIPALFDPVTFLAPANGTTVDLSTLVTTNPGAITPTLVTQAQAAATAAAASAVAAAASAASVTYRPWAATTAYTSGQIVQAPDGSALKANSSRTSRATFDATEQTFWTVVFSKQGTLEELALRERLGTVSVKTFGAKGDYNGTTGTDDTAAIQAAINSLPAQGVGVASGGTVFLPAGHYKVTSALTVPAGVRLLGVQGVSGYENAGGHMGTVIAATTAAMTLFSVDGGATIIQNGPQCENIVFTDGVGQSCTAFLLRYVNRMRWINCSFTHFNIAIKSGLNNGGDCSWHKWDGCHWYDNVKGITDSGFGNGGIGGTINGGNFYLNTSRGLDLGEHSSMRVQGTKFDQTTGICIATKGYRSTFEVDLELNGSCVGVQLDGNTAVVPSPQAGYWNVVRAAMVNHGTATGVNVTNQAVEAEVDCRFDNFGVGATTIADAGKNTRIKGSNVQVFTAGGTWTKPTWATKVTAICVGAGGGGGSGAVVASGTAASGGGGGGGGGYTSKELPASLLSATVTITVGAAGSAGAAAGTGASAGNAGGAGGGSFFGPYARAQGGGAGGAGQSAANSSAGGAGFATTLGGAGGSDTSGAAGGGGSGSGAAGGGGAGGGINATPTATAGGAGGNSSATSQTGPAGGAVNTAGAAGGAVAAGDPSGGAGGSGGGSSITANGGAGGAGGQYGGGGGGGGAALTTHNSGAGAAGAAGIVIVISE